VRELAEQLRNGLDLVRTRWLEGNVRAGLGHHDEAVGCLNQVRSDFEQHKLPFDYALASLDLALVYQRQGRPAEVRELAEEMLEIFRAFGVDREAIAALILFRDAAQKEAITVDLVKRLQDYLEKARVNPKLRFEAEA
jgi:tetratricopeptide (TPR) repeat protein